MAATAVLLGGQAGPAGDTALAAESCSPQPAPLVVCVPDPTVTGVVPVTATVTTGATVESVLFTWDGGYLVTDHDPAYSMVLDSRRLPNGTRTLTATATTNQGTLSAGVTVTVANATPSPAPPPFVPRTAAAGPDGRVTLAAVGDGADGSPASAAVVDLVDSWDADAFAYLGDVYDNGSAFELDTWYGDDAGYGRFRSSTNPTVGNHEMRTDLGAPYFAFWGQVPHYYSYDLGGWHVVVLDSTTEFAQVSPGTPQYDWLVADLAAHQGACTLAYLHHPRYTAVSGVGRTGLSQVWSLLVQQNVTLLMAAHAHTYERWTPLDAAGNAAEGGLTQFVVGTGGRPILNAKVPEPRVLAQATRPGALHLALGSDDATFTFASTDGQYADSGVVPCRRPPAPPDTTAPTAPAGVRAKASSPTAAGLTWSASSDAVGVAGYTVRRDGAEVAGLGAGSTSFRDAGLAPERAYAWTVEAFDAAGNRSAASTPATATTPFPTRPTRALLRALRRAPEHDRALRSGRFPAWTDADRDGCRTDREVLLAEALRPPRVGTGCRLTGGRWRSPYDGRHRTRTRGLTVEQMVPVAEAWRSGASRWRPAVRRQYANDLGYPGSLVAVTRRSAAHRDGREPQDWLPVRAYRCTYAADWVAVKWRWRLAVDAPERRFLARTLRGCGWPEVRATTRVPTR